MTLRLILNLQRLFSLYVFTHTHTHTHKIIFSLQVVRIVLLGSVAKWVCNHIARANINKRNTQETNTFQLTIKMVYLIWLLVSLQ